MGRGSWIVGRGLLVVSRGSEIPRRYLHVMYSENPLVRTCIFRELLIVVGRGSRVAGKMSRVAGTMSLVAGRLSRVAG